MSSTATSLAPKERLEELFEELAELTGQRNAINGRVVDIVAELERDELCGMTGARSVPALVAWKTGVSPHNAEKVVTVARRLEEFPRCAEGMREGQLSLDQVGVIADSAANGSDEHYAQFAASATVRQLRKAIDLAPKPKPPPDPEPRPEPARSISKIEGEQSTTYRIVLPHAEAAMFDAAVQSHHDALVADWKRDHPDGGPEQAPPFPTQVDGFTSLVGAGWDTDVARRPHGQRTTVVVHVDLEQRIAALHLGPLLSDSDRRELTCDATCEVWFERHGQLIGSGRETRTISRRLRRALEHRDRCCVVPGCGAARGLHAHHIRHWEDGGLTELFNLVLVGVSVPSSVASPRWHHHQRTRRPARRHRLRGQSAEPGIVGPATNPTPTRGRTLSRADRGTRRLVVVPTIRTPTGEQLSLRPTASAFSSSGSKARTQRQTTSFAACASRAAYPAVNDRETVPDREGIHPSHRPSRPEAPGLDGVYVGPSDLRIAVGGSSPGDPSVDDQFEAAIVRIHQAASAAGIAAGIHTPSGDVAARRLGGGYTFASVASDLTHLKAASMAHLKAGLQQ